MIYVYTDGACSKGNGGWAWWVAPPPEANFDFGAERGTTNNRMELQAVVEALQAFGPTFDLTIVSDSAYVVNCFTERWYDGWRARGWRNSQKKPVENRDLWEKLLYLVENHHGRLEWVHVRGHGKRASDDPVHVAGNDQADRLAVQARLTLVEA